MKDSIDPRNDMVDEIYIEYRAEHELTVGITLKMGNVGESPGREVVEQEHLIATLEKPIRQMGSDEARSTGDQSTH
jgi:CRISPR/Cas system CSM-associated protein Csm2 small subunit